MSKYFLGWDRDNRPLQLCGAVLIAVGVTAWLADAITTATWAAPVADVCTLLLCVVTLITLSRQAAKRRRQPQDEDTR